MKRLFLLFVLTVAGLYTVHAAEPATAPVLRIEAGMHTAPIRHVAADASGRLALTVSHDKTARLWELPSGRLLRVLHPPQGEGDEGKLYSGALSPDGTLAAVGGWTGNEWDQAASVYLFDTATGRMVRRLSGLPSTIHDLAFSAQGRFLAAVLYGGEGLRVWETSTGREVGRDTEYGSQSSNGVNWHGEDRLVTACNDGQLRLYRLGVGPSTASAGSGPGGKLTLTKKSAVKGGQQPFSARFSPDGRRIAVGFADSTAVAVVDGSDLSFLFAPDTAGIDKGNLMVTTWADDGTTLAAGGLGRKLVNDEWMALSRSWGQSGRGSPRDTAVTGNTITDLRPLPGGRILFGSYDPAWGVVESGKSGSISRKVLGASPNADYRDDRSMSHFRVSSDGATVAFIYVPDGKKVLARFSLAARELTLLADAAAANHLRAPRLDGLKVTDWLDTTDPKLDGKAILLERYETSHSLATAGDASSFLLGLEWTLRSFTAQGKERWQMPVPGIAWAVNLTADDRLAVVAYGDGTIRWHRYDNGRELLAFFPPADRKRWVLWTPQGYYDCSPGAEDLIGWHVNRGKDHEADFYPAAKFREQFYRPDVIQRVLAKGDVAAALQEANGVGGRKAQPVARVEDVVTKMQPPIVELAVGGAQREATVAAGVKSFTVRYRVRRAGGEAVTGVRVLVDGRPAKVEAPIPASDTAEAGAEVPLPARDCIVAVLAENRFAVSEPATLRLRRAGAPEPETARLLVNAPAASKGKLYVLAVGVADVKMNDAFDIDGDGRVTEEELRVRDPGVTVPFADLHFADADARDIAKSFAAQEGLLYSKVESRVLVNKEATAAAIKDGLEWIKGQTTARDVAVVFLSGHGENDNEGRFFLSHEYDQKRRLSTGVSFAEIEQTIKDPAGKMLFFIDACHAGNALGKLAAKGGGVGAGAVDINRLVNELAEAENGAVVFASSTGRQQSLEDPKLKHGLFAQAVIEGLAGKADLLGKGQINVSGLEAYVCDRVKEYSEGQQTPTVAKPQTVPDFPIAVKR